MKGLRDWNLQVIKWLVHQSRPCLRAKVSAVKLEAIGPVEKDRELDVLHLEHVTYTPAPPEPKREGTDLSVHNWMSQGGGRIVCLKQTGVGLYCCLFIRNEGGNREVCCRPWGERGTHDQSLTWGWEWLCGRRTE